MAEAKRTKYILHVSDFHLSGENLTLAAEGLKCLCQKLDDEDISVDYLIHTGDIIDSQNTYVKVVEEMAKKDPEYKRIANECIKEDKKKKRFLDEKLFKRYCDSNSDVLPFFNYSLVEYNKKLVEDCWKTVDHFLTDLRVRRSNVFCCIGNHDTIRPIMLEDCPECDRLEKDDGNTENYQHFLEDYSKDYSVFTPYLQLLHKLGIDDITTNKKELKETTDIRLVALNTNYRNPNNGKTGYYCVNCDSITETLNNSREESDKKLHIVIAHKPVYEICEAARMTFTSFHKTKFLSALQSFLGENGVYICGDKHTRSVARTAFHNMHHIIGGSPLSEKENNSDLIVEYNLIELLDGEINNTQKIHLEHVNEKWTCVFRPEDATVNTLYDLSAPSISPETLLVLGSRKTSSNWEDISQMFQSNPTGVKWEKLEKGLDNLYSVITKFKADETHYEKPRNGDNTANGTIFFSFREYLKRKIEEEQKNIDRTILNIKGEYGSGKSTFLGSLYIYLLYQYSIGEIKFVPAYFNLENDELMSQIGSSTGHVRYYDIAVNSFKRFATQVEQIAKSLHKPVLFIIDGLDEQDVWSYSSEDSIGRGILDVLSKIENAKNMMSFSQHHLPLFKYTMPQIKYKDDSDFMYINNLNISSAGMERNRLEKYLEAFYALKALGNRQSSSFSFDSDAQKKIVIDLIRRFRRLTISQNFLYKFDLYFADIISYCTTKSGEADREKFDREITVDRVYKDYTDLLHSMCLQRLGYGFVQYAPAMAFLFSCKGFTYERFRLIPRNAEDFWERQIAAHSDKVYEAFLFIKKNQDIREYLIAMHYNRELRFYAEKPEIPVSEMSILHELIGHNVAHLSRRMWKSDPNKFVIACRDLLKKRHELGQPPLGNTVLSMLIYTLAHQVRMYEPSNKMIGDLIAAYDADTGKINDEPKGCFSFENIEESKRLQAFLNYGLYRSYKLYQAESSGNSIQLAVEVHDNEDFKQYNRQYWLLYYGDLTISGENKKPALNPGTDNCLKGFDFHNTFNSLVAKLDDMVSQKYALMEFDLFSLCDFVESRMKSTHPLSFFSGERNTMTQLGVLYDAVRLIKKYTDYYGENNRNIRFGNYLETYRKSFVDKGRKLIESNTNGVIQDDWKMLFSDETPKTACEEE